MDIDISDMQEVECCDMQLQQVAASDAAAFDTARCQACGMSKQVRLVTMICIFHHVSGTCMKAACSLASMWSKLTFKSVLIILYVGCSIDLRDTV